MICSKKPRGGCRLGGEIAPAELCCPPQLASKLNFNASIHTDYRPQRALADLYRAAASSTLDLAAQILQHPDVERAPGPLPKASRQNTFAQLSTPGIALGTMPRYALCYLWLALKDGLAICRL